MLVLLVAAAVCACLLSPAAGQGCCTTDQWQGIEGTMTGYVHDHRPGSLEVGVGRDDDTHPLHSLLQLLVHHQKKIENRDDFIDLFVALSKAKFADNFHIVLSRLVNLKFK